MVKDELKKFADWLQGRIWDDKHDDFSDYVDEYIKEENIKECWLPQTAFNSDICMACGKHRNEH